MANPSRDPQKPPLSIQSIMTDDHIGHRAHPDAHPDTHPEAQSHTRLDSSHPSSSTPRRLNEEVVPEIPSRFATRPETSPGYGLPGGSAFDSVTEHRRSISSTAALHSSVLRSPMHPQQSAEGSSSYQCNPQQLPHPQPYHQQQQQSPRHQSWHHSQQSQNSQSNQYSRHHQQNQQQQHHYSYHSPHYQQYQQYPHYQQYHYPSHQSQHLQNYQLPPYRPPYLPHQNPHQQQHSPQESPQQSPLRPSFESPRLQHQSRQQQQQYQQQYQPETSPHLAPIRSPILQTVAGPSRPYFSPAASGPDQPEQQEQDPVHSPSPAPPTPTVQVGSVRGGSREPSEPVQGAASIHSAEYSSSSPAIPDSDALPSAASIEPKRGGAAAAVIKRPPMRSSIACVRCRRSKIKCVNNGEGKAACETCLKSRRECCYPGAGTSSSTQKTDPELQFVSVSASGAAGKAPANSLKREESSQPAERPAADRKRLKKTEDSFRLDAQMSGAFYANEVLSAPFLTERMWSDIFDIYQLNFATELPFLHMPTLKEKMGDKFKTSEKRRSDSTNLVLLGVLTLTSQFHSDLVKYINYSQASQNGIRVRGGFVKPDPSAASEYYADVLTRALGPLQSSMTTVSVERVQAFLMLGLYEWSQSKKKTNGLGAWMYVGVAIRMAQALGLCFEEQPSSRRRRIPDTRETRVPSSSSASTSTGRLFNDNLNSEANAEDIVRQEIRRRTMFSCFILDRLLACGKGRMPAIRSDDLHIQLPCSEFSFDLSEKVQTGFLKPVMQVLQAGTPVGMGGGVGTTTAASETESVSASSTVTRPSHDSVLARFVSLIDIWGEISKYSFSGGRLMEKRPPWEDSQFRRLRNTLDDFYANLPSTFRLSSSNYHKHENHHASGAYVSLHMLGAVCQIMLHREYVPFIPIRCRKPMGPLDEPIFPEGSSPAGFWDESAEQMFKAAHDIVMLTDICIGRRKMPMSALTVFSVWTAAFVGIYAWHFPQLDTHKHMCWNSGSDQSTSSEGAEAGAGDGGEGSRSNGDNGDNAAAAATDATAEADAVVADSAGTGGGSSGADDDAGPSRGKTRSETRAAFSSGPGPGPGPANAESPYHVTRNGPTGTAFSVLQTMSRSLHMATVYVKCFTDMDKYYEGVKKDFQEHTRQHGNKPAGRGGVRQGGQGGGLDEWKVHGVRITNNGSIIPSDDAGATEDSDMTRASTREVGGAGAAGSTSGRGGAVAAAASASTSTPAPGPDLGQATDSRGTRGQFLAPAGGSIQSAAAASNGGEGPSTSSRRGRGGRAGRGRGGGAGASTRREPLSDGDIIVVEDDADGSEPMQPAGGIRQGQAPGAPVAGSAYTTALPPPHLPPWAVGGSNGGGGAYSHHMYMTSHQGMQHPQHRHQAHVSGFVDMDVLYAAAPVDVEQYVDKNQGKRWQEASQATGIEQFSHGDANMSATDEMWAPATTTYGMYQPPGAYTDMLEY